MIIDTDLQGEGNGILLKDSGTTYGNIFRTDSDLVVMSSASNEDLILNEKGGSGITALTLDMSAAGEATFNSDILLKDATNIRFGNGQDFRIGFDANNAILYNAAADSDIIFNGNDSDGGGAFTALTLDMSAAGAATFSAGVFAGAASSFPSISINNNSYIGSANNTTAIQIATSGATTFSHAITANAGATIAGTTNDGTTLTQITQSGTGRGLAVNRNVASATRAMASLAQLSASGGAEAVLDIQQTTPASLAIRVTPDGSTGRFSVYGTGALVTTPAAGGHAVFNEIGVDVDFRVESDGNANMLFVDGGNNRVGIGRAPASVFEVHIDTNKNIGYSGGQGELGNVPALVAYNDDGSLNDIGFRGTTVRFASASQERLRIDDAGVVANEGSHDADFRVESNGNANMLFVDGGNNRVGIGTSNPVAQFAVGAAGRRIEVDGDSGIIRGFDGSTGRFSVYGTGALVTTPAAGGHAVFNEIGVDVDFRVESDGNANMLFVDGGTNRVGIGKGSPGHALSLGSGSSFIHLGYNGTSTNTEVGRISSNSYDVDNSSYSLAEMNFVTTSANGYTGEIQFRTNSVNSTNSRAAERLRIGTAGQIGIGGANYGTDGQVLTSTGTSSAPAWEDAGGGAYNAWLIKTTTFTASSGDQLIANHASTAFTITLPASPSAGDTVTLKNAGAALLTVGRNSQNIDSAAEDATMPTGNAAQLVYVDATIGWTVL